MSDAKAIALILGLFVLAVLGVVYEINVWKECLEDKSWWYCLRILSK